MTALAALSSHADGPLPLRATTLLLDVTADEESAVRLHACAAGSERRDPDGGILTVGSTHKDLDRIHTPPSLKLTGSRRSDPHFSHAPLASLAAPCMLS